MHFQDSIKSTNEFHATTVSHHPNSPFLAARKAGKKDLHELQRRSFPSQCLMIICSRLLIIAQHGPLTVYSEIKVVHQAAFLGRQINLFHRMPSRGRRS